VFNWLRDSNYNVTGYSRKAIDAVVNQLKVDMTQSIIQLTASGPASYVSEQSVPAPPALPTNWTTGFQPQASQFGEAFLDTTQITPYEFNLTLDNAAKQLPVPFGSQYADGVIFGTRDIKIDLVVDATDQTVGYLTDAEQKNPHALFAHSGATQGRFFGIFCPKLTLALNDYTKNDVTLRLNFTNSVAFATQADNELVIAIA